MKKLNYEELKIVNGGAFDAGRNIVIYSKDGVSVVMSIEDHDWLVSEFGSDFAQKFTGYEIARLVMGRYLMQGMK